MLNTYLYSSVAFRSKSSPYYYSSNDYYLLNNRVNNTPSSSSCTCCAIPFNGVPLNPSLFYGFRQSTLIHLLPTNRLMLGGADRFRRIPTCDFDTFSCGSSCSVNQACQCCCTRRRDSCMSCDFGTDSRICKESCLDRSTSRRRRGKERRFKCMVWEEKDDSYGLGIDETTEAMLGLLAEEKTENSIPVKGWRSRLAAKSIQEERKTSGYSKKKKDPESDYLEKGSKGTFQSGLKLREHDCKSLGRRESSLKVENHNLRKDGSSCSSYYTALSPDEIDMSDVDGIDGSDLEVRVKHGKFSGESSSMNKKELRRGKEDVHVKNVRKQAKQKDEDAFGYRDVTWEGNSVMGSTRVGVGSDRHMRNTREKKITDVSVQEGESRSESIKRSSDVMQNHTNGAEMTIDGQDHFRDRGNNSISSSYSVDATEQCGEQDESGRNFQRSSGKLEAEGRYFESVSNSQTQLKGRKNNLSAAPVNISKEERKTVRQAAQGVLNSHDTNTGTTSASERQFESTSKNREESSTSSVHMAEGKSYSTDQRVVWETKPTKQSQHPSNVSVISDSGTTIFNNSKNIFETRMSPQEKISAADVSRLSKNHDNNIRSTSTSPRFSGSSAKNREEISTSLLSSVRNAEDQHGRAERFVSQVDSPRDSHGRPNISAASVSDVMVIGVPLKPLERRISPKEEHSASRANLFKEVREENTQLASEHTIKQLESRDQPKRLIEMSSFGESSADMASSSQPLQFSQQASEKQMGEQKESWRNSQKKMAPLPSQIVEKASKETMRYQEPTDKNATGNVHSEKSGGEHSTLTNQEAAPSSLDESNSGTKIDKVYDDQSNMYHEDALGSASRLEESSMQFVQQFVEHLSHEVSATELPEKKLASETTSIYKDVQQSFVEQIPEDVHLKVPVSGRSLSRSGARGPSDEMWDVAGPSAEVPARTEAPSEDTSTSKSAIVRSGRSLWNIFGDIVRFRWGARSGGKSSSNESGGSEAWFSSHEADEKDDENVKKGRRSMPKGHGPSGQTSLVRAGTQSGSGASEGTSSNSKRLHPEGDTSSSLDTAVGQLASKAPSLVSKEEGTSQQFGERSGSQGIPSRNTTASPSLSRHLMRSPAVKGEIAESSKPVASRSDLIQMEQPLREIPIEGPGTEVKDGELKRRKLQKNKQVERETFEEWEEAYRVESDQRKIDEMFMREALLEAKKAADTWEVPVGAVLVQHGKIVARGCNLVEDLRDSTAHAEMICIREASKTLRTWRLAETTLYVTLEPCAMCAGAILQARVDTVVWGAPNKLLGADGSWVRLFPGGGEVGSTSELSSQPAGPIHPFHPKITVRRGILATECADIMQQFFRLRRKKDNKLESPPTSSLSVSTHPSKFISKMHDIFGIMFCL